MSHFFQRPSAPERSEFEEVRKVLCRLRSSDSETRSAVGGGVYLANAAFIRQFEGIESFRRIAAEEQERFWSELSDLELSLRSQKAGMALGVGLYRIWLREAVSGPRSAAEMLGPELAELTRIAAGV